MPLTPRRMAPPYDIAGNRVQRRYQADHGGRLSRSVTFRPRTRRARSRSRDDDDCQTSDRQGRNSRKKTLLALALVVVLSVAVLHSFRHRELEVAGEDEARLRREVQGLEDTLRRKKALLGVAPGLPPENWDSDRGDGGGGTPRGGGGGWPSKHAEVELAEEVEGENRTQPPRPPVPVPPAPHQSPPIPKGSLAGEALFGSTPPVRPSLESRPSLIREPVPLIVGGTDGSGTRGVVALLQRLKVPMVIEDDSTMDVHGAPYMVEGGWPMVVRPVIEWARGAGYEPRAAPAHLRRMTFDALDNLRAQMQQVRFC